MSLFSDHKARILKLTNHSWINLQVAKDKAKVKLISTVEDAEAVLKVLTKPRKITPPVPEYVRERYQEAHRLWFQRSYPEAWESHYVDPVMPKIYTANGLTTFAINFITYHGFRATRVAASGRMVKGKWIKGPTRPGSSDVSATINGKSVMLEIKIGSDQPSDKQLNEQRRERNAGGVYEFVRSAEDVIALFDGIVYG